MLGVQFKQMGQLPDMEHAKAIAIRITVYVIFPDQGSFNQLIVL
jgi:hypothetical protein